MQRSQRLTVDCCGSGVRAKAKEVFAVQNEEKAALESRLEKAKEVMRMQKEKMNDLEARLQAQPTGLTPTASLIDVGAPDESRQV